jgi:hypothetical protein
LAIRALLGHISGNTSTLNWAPDFVGSANLRLSANPNLAFAGVSVPEQPRQAGFRFASHAVAGLFVLGLAGWTPFLFAVAVAFSFVPEASGTVTGGEDLLEAVAAANRVADPLLSP